MSETEAEAAYRLCEQALAIDPDNVRALVSLSYKFLFSVTWELSADPKGDIERADQLVSRALALDPNYASAHLHKAGILDYQGRVDESLAECERALALDPSLVVANAQLGVNYLSLGQFEKSIESIDKALRLSPRDPLQGAWLHVRAGAYFGLKQYDQAIESARRSIAISPDKSPWAYWNLIAALALTGHEAEAHETLERYLAFTPKWPKTIAAWSAAKAPFTGLRASPRLLEILNRMLDGLRKAGMPEQ